MSKAFKTNDGGEDTGLDPTDVAEAEAAATQGIPLGSKNYMTAAGALKLKTELKSLLNEVRPEVVRTVSWAASNGDRSENGDYIYGKRRLREIDRRIRFLTKRLELSEIVDLRNQPRDTIRFGARVTVETEDGKEQTNQIVGLDESDPSKRRVSWSSPFARAVLGAKLGDRVVLKTPRGEEELVIRSFDYPEFTD